MKIFPWAYSNSSGRGYQMIMSGHVQFNLVWEYGADHVRVERSDNGEGFREIKRVAIPSDYRGKSKVEISGGMDDHMKSIARKLTRDHEGEYGLTEFRNEWALMEWAWPRKFKVTYSTIGSGTLLGVVVGQERRGSERDLCIRVTSRKNPHYKCGEIIRVSPTCPWLKVRKAGK